jgi:hypothetical protein
MTDTPGLEIAVAPDAVVGARGATSPLGNFRGVTYDTGMAGRFRPTAA